MNYRSFTSYSISSFTLFVLLCLTANSVAAQTTAFTYQGKLVDNGNLANANYDMQFKLFDAATNGNQIGATLTFDGSTGNPPPVSVTNGIFTVNLDFGSAALSVADRFLEISLRPAGNPGGYQQLLPRQKLTSAPYAVQALNATNATTAVTATNATQLGGVAASQYVVTSDARLSDARNPLPNSPNYVQNTTTQQASSNFNINGNGIIGGNLGIGTSTPAKLLHLSGVGSNGLGIGDLLITGTGSTGAALTLESTGASGRKFSWISTSTSASSGAGKLAVFDATAGAYRLVIDSVGSVGIGTTSPTAKLHIEGGGTTGVYSFTTSGTGVRGTSTNSIGVEGNSTNAIGVYGSGPNGYGVYGTSTNAIGVLGHTGNANSFAGYFEGNVRVTGTLSQGSDARLKQNISTLSYGLAEVLRLRPVSWRWKDHPESGEQLGLVAQEVEPVLPELVSTAKDAEQMKGLNYTGLIPVVVNAIQQQQQQLAKQQHQLVQYRAQLQQQHQQISQQQAQTKEQKAQLIKQQLQIDALKKLVCADHPDAAICKAN